MLYFVTLKIVTIYQIYAYETEFNEQIVLYQLGSKFSRMIGCKTGTNISKWRRRDILIIRRGISWDTGRRINLERMNTVVLFASHFKERTRERAVKEK